MKSDPTIDEIRRVRHEMSAEYGHDPRRILEYFASIQARVKERLVNHGEPGPLGGSSRSTAAVDHRASDSESTPAAR
jgi:hypothetical protein